MKISINQDLESKLTAYEMGTKYELTTEYVDFTHNLLLAIEGKISVKSAIKSVLHCKDQMTAIDIRVIDLLNQKLQSGHDYTEALNNCFKHFGAKASRQAEKPKQVDDISVHGKCIWAKCDNSDDYWLKYISEYEAQRAYKYIIKQGYIEV